MFLTNTSRFLFLFLFLFLMHKNKLYAYDNFSFNADVHYGYGKLLWHDKNQSYTHWHPYLIILIITNSTHLKRFIMWGNTIKLA